MLVLPFLLFFGVGGHMQNYIRPTTPHKQKVCLIKKHAKRDVATLQPVAKRDQKVMPIDKNLSVCVFYM